MLINTPEDEMPTTTAKLLTALQGINVRVFGTDDTVIDVEVKGGVERDDHCGVNLLCHPWKSAPGMNYDVCDYDTTLVIPCHLITTIEVR